MVAHVDGNDHNAVSPDQTSELCTTCHFHDFDGNWQTSDGFMPNAPALVFGKSQPTGTPGASLSATPVLTQTAPTTTPAATETAVPTPRASKAVPSPTQPGVIEPTVATPTPAGTLP
jgi:hypothetical protein